MTKPNLAQRMRKLTELAKPRETAIARAREAIEAIARTGQDCATFYLLADVYKGHGEALQEYFEAEGCTVSKVLGDVLCVRW